MLPVLKPRLVNINIPSNNSNINFRVLLGKDDKVLKTAISSNNYNNILKSIHSILKDCSNNNPLLEELSLVELELLFIKLYKESSSQGPKHSYKDKDDGKVRDFTIDLSQVNIKWPEKDNKIISITNKLKLIMKYPNTSLLDSKILETKDDDSLLEHLILNCVDKIVDGDSNYDLKLETKENIEKWLSEIPLDSYTSLLSFFQDLPTIFYELEFTNDLGEKRTIIMKNLNDIFNWL